MSETLIEAAGLSKHFDQGANRLQVLDGVDLSVYTADRIAITGLSGSGKSTLLHLLGGLDKPSSGRVMINGRNIQRLNEKALCDVRNRALGFIYQFHHLMMEFSALENVAMPLMIRGLDRASCRSDATEVLVRVGLAERLHHRPAQLSGGERQRVAIARAMAGKPDCILADEPTGNLDEKTAARVDDLMLQLSQESGISFIIVTHNMALAKRMDISYQLHNGKLIR